MSGTIEPRSTPNPNARKYVLPGWRFAQTRNLSSVDEAAAYPPAGSLFGLQGVYNVLLAQDFVTVNKRPDVPWEALEPQVLQVLTNWLEKVR